MKHLLATLAALVAATTSYARIGETMEQATERYGEPWKIKDSEKWPIAFFKGNFEIHVHFHDGKIDMIEYRKYPVSVDDVQAETPTVELSEVEVYNFLKANYDGPWRAVFYQQWATTNLYATQEYHVLPAGKGPGYYRLGIWTRAAQQRFDDELSAAQIGF